MPVEIFAQTQTGYEDALTVGPSQLLKTINFAISAPYSVVAQIAKLGKNGIPYWDESEVTIQPGQGSYDNVYGIRFRSFDPSNPTTVLAIGFYKDDPTPLGFIPGTGSFGTSGSVSPISGTSITGIVNSNGTIAAGTGYSVVHSGTGQYAISYTTPFAASPVVLAIPIAGSAVYARISTGQSGSGCTVVIESGSGSLTDSAFCFLAQTVN